MSMQILTVSLQERHAGVDWNIQIYPVLLWLSSQDAVIC